MALYYRWLRGTTMFFFYYYYLESQEVNSKSKLFLKIRANLVFIWNTKRRISNTTNLYDPLTSFSNILCCLCRKKQFLFCMNLRIINTSKPTPETAGHNLCFFYKQRLFWHCIGGEKIRFIFEYWQWSGRPSS